MYFFALCQRRAEKYWTVMHLILLLLVYDVTKWQRPRSCFCGFQSSIFKKQDEKSSEKLLYVHFINSIPVDLTLRCNSPLKHLYEYELPGQVSGKNTFISRWIPLLSRFSQGMPFFFFFFFFFFYYQDHRNYKGSDVLGGNSFSQGNRK